MESVCIFFLPSFICDALRDLVPFVQFEKRKKHPWRSVTFSKVAVFTKSNIPPWVFFLFFKLYKWYQIAQDIFSSYEILHRIQLSLHKKP